MKDYMKKGKMKKGKMKKSYSGAGTGNGAKTGLKIKNDMRSDTTKPITSKNPYPNGLS